MDAVRQPEPCWTCENPETCDCENYDEYADPGCDRCGDTGYYVPSHCCACGGSPYCQCCRACGAECIGECKCPVEVTLHDGGTLTL